MNNNRKSKNSLIIASAALLLFAVLTVLLFVLDVRPIGPAGSEIGLAGINEFMLSVQKSVPENLQTLLYDVSEIIGLASLAIMFAFAAFGAVQLIRRKSLKKIDLNLYFLAGLYALMLALYVGFEVIIINYRPILVEGTLEASYPSSHTFLSVCVMFSAAFMLCNYFKNRAVHIIANLAALILSLLTLAGRFLSCMHWFTDILGAILLSIALIAAFFAACYKYYK